MRLGLTFLAAALLGAPLASPAAAASVEPDPAWMTEGKCQAVCGSHMWWRNHPQDVVDKSSVCLFSLQSALRNERAGIAAYRARDTRTGGMFINRRTADLKAFTDCVNQGIRRRNFDLYADHNALDGKTGYDDGGLSPLHGELTLEGAPVWVHLEEGHDIGDFLEGNLSSVNGGPLRFTRARGQIVGGDRFRVDWVQRPDGTRMRVGRVIRLETGYR